MPVKFSIILEFCSAMSSLNLFLYLLFCPGCLGLEEELRNENVYHEMKECRNQGRRREGDFVVRRCGTRDVRHFLKEITFLCKREQGWKGKAPDDHT